MVTAARAGVGGFVAVMVLSFAGACGTLGGEGGGEANLPTAGLGPWRMLGPDETRAAPFVSTYREVEGGPHVVAEADGGWSLYYAFQGPHRTDIARASSTDGITFDVSRTVFWPEAEWEGFAVGNPCVVHDGDVIRLYYDADGGIGVAEQRGDGDFGHVWDEPILAGDVRAPSVVAAPGGGWHLYYETDVGIRLATSEDGLSFTVLDSGPVLAPGNADPAARVYVTPTGRYAVQLFFIFTLGTSETVGAAASFDGVTFSLSPENPVLEVGRPVVGLGPPVDAGAFDLLPLTIERGDGFGVAGALRVSE